MIMRLAGMVVLLAMSQGTIGVHGQAPESTKLPVFDVASVKPSAFGSYQTRADMRSEGVNFINLPLRAIVQFAFGITQPTRILGLPDWAVTERFDVVAKPPDKATRDELRLMLQALLHERFKLEARQESREVNVYALVLARRDGQLGPKLRPSTSDCLPPRAPGGAAAPERSGAQDRPTCGTQPAGPGHLVVINVPITQLATGLSMINGRTVIDKTGLTGSFDVDLTFTSDTPRALRPDGVPTEAAANPDAPSLFTALQEQLGLKLEPQRASEDVVVVDRIERPSTN
jgi:uncharacterized protein (TIGR03435 family)